jgi:hypothetical protein
MVLLGDSPLAVAHRRMRPADNDQRIPGQFADALRLQRLLDPAGSRGPAFSKVGSLPTTVVVQEWCSSGNWVGFTGIAVRLVPALFRQGGDAYRAVQPLGKSVCLRVGVIGASIARC